MRPRRRQRRNPPKAFRRHVQLATPDLLGRLTLGRWFLPPGLTLRRHAGRFRRGHRVRWHPRSKQPN